MRADYARDRRGVAGRLDDDHVLSRQSGRKGAQSLAAHVDAPHPCDLAVAPRHRFSEGAVDIQSDNAHAGSLRALLVPIGSRRATRQLLIRAHGASGRVARGGHVTSSGSQPNVCWRPARTFVLPVPRVPDGLTIRPSSGENSWTRKAPQASCRITASSSVSTRRCWTSSTGSRSASGSTAQSPSCRNLTKEVRPKCRLTRG